MKPYTSHELIGLLHVQLEKEAALRIKKRVVKHLGLIRPKPTNGKAGKHG